MNGPNLNHPFPHNQPYAPQNVQIVRIILDYKMFYQQRLHATFGAERVNEINASPEPFIFPVINYPLSFDVNIFILTN